MDDMRGLIVVVAIFGFLAVDVAFNDSAVLTWVGTHLGLR
jgi:hypothetical protein